jgi:hypothetical protein
MVRSLDTSSEPTGLQARRNLSTGKRRRCSNPFSTMDTSRQSAADRPRGTIRPPTTRAIFVATEIRRRTIAIRNVAGSHRVKAPRISLDARPTRVLAQPSRGGIASPVQQRVRKESIVEHRRLNQEARARGVWGKRRRVAGKLIRRATAMADGSVFLLPRTAVRRTVAQSRATAEALETTDPVMAAIADGSAVQARIRPGNPVLEDRPLRETMDADQGGLLWT